MGNCSMKGTIGECHHTIQVMSDCEAILPFKALKTVAQVLQHYLGYGIFRQGHASEPLLEQERLSYGLFYYLLLLKDRKNCCCDNVRVEEGVRGLRSKFAACDYVENLSNGSALEVLPVAKNGVWRLKLVIEQRQLEEILSEQVNNWRRFQIFNMTG
ncbi:uncharacterized protein LOC108341347 [Vigna angularis]|uniref:uncharacterized protein LOC108341347 n=1 Tax=Phaseolus angularis TaxID=3914 RepID=UPI00080A0451|nr:uncharacterized protein LOC108341347 [Vigna angularis]